MGKVILAAMVWGAGAGYVVAKTGIDVQLRNALIANRRSIVADNAHIMADVFESRKVGIPIATAKV
jgi:hypothetical protein